MHLKRILSRNVGRLEDCSPLSEWEVCACEGGSCQIRKAISYKSLMLRTNNLTRRHASYSETAHACNHRHFRLPFNLTFSVNSDQHTTY
jgi:hypothetical protein